jgi:hypothetical protein
MEKNYIQKFLKIIVLMFSIVMLMQLIGCEDDAILEPQPTDDCTGSYCNLSLPTYENYAHIKKINPSIF